MHTFNTPATVNRQEAEALKEMIFNRVKARAEAMNQEVHESYVDNVQTELMDLARVSLASNKNPFSDTKSSKSQETKSIVDESEKVTVEKTETTQFGGLGFNQDHPSYLSSQIKLRTATSNEEIAKSAVLATMEEAHKGLQNKSSFMGALNFLNSQASIAIVNKKGARFEANA